MKEKYNFDYKVLHPFKWYILENFPFLEDSIDALTNYELFCKLGKEINKQIDSLNILGTQVEGITDWFDDLDVQEEINNKLDEMAESGELEEIIASYLNTNALICFDSVSDMVSSENLVNGSYAKTLGFYSVNDGGSATYKIRTITNDDVVDNMTIIALSDDSLIAELIVLNDTININQLGAKADGTTDNAAIINKSLEKANITFIPEGDYLINSTLNMRFNTTIQGVNKKSKILIGNNLLNDYAIKYGSSYSYGDKNGIIEDITIEAVNQDNPSSYGILLNSGIKIERVMFNYLKGAIRQQDNQYIDKIEIIGCSLNYCTGYNNIYAIHLDGNKDQLKIDTLNSNQGYLANTFDVHCGIFIKRCTEGYIKNSVVNVPLLIDSSVAFSVEDCHFEGSQSATYKGNKSYIQIDNSKTSLKDLYFHKRVDGANIVLLGAYDDHKSNICEIQNIFITITPVNFDLYQDIINYEIEKAEKTILKISNACLNVDFSAIWQQTNEVVGIRLKENDLFNKHSSYYSISSIVGTDNKVISDIPTLTDDYANANMFQYSGSNDKIKFYQTGLSGSNQYITGVLVYDETRKLAVERNTAVQTITNVTSTASGVNGRGIMLRLLPNIKYTGKGLILHYYRGDSSGAYTHITKIPVLCGSYLYDFGTFVNGCKTEARTSGDIDEYNYVSKCETKGSNVIFHASAIPTVGTFTKGDKCINTNISSGQVKEWIYNGSTWISCGTY